MPAVSILTLLAKGFCQPIYVSIHTRHYWRVKLDTLLALPEPTMFQSTPAITGG